MAILAQAPSFKPCRLCIRIASHSLRLLRISLRAFTQYYIDDFVDGVLRSLTRDEAVGETFNVGAPRNTVTMYQLACDVVETCESRSGIAFTPIKHSDVHLRAPNVAKARELLGYEPQVSLADGLRVTADWYRETGRLIAPAFMAG